MKPDPNKHVVTVWKDGTYKVWGAMDAYYAQADPDFLMNVGVVDVLAEMERDFRGELEQPNASRGVNLRALTT